MIAFEFVRQYDSMAQWLVVSIRANLILELASPRGNTMLYEMSHLFLSNNSNKQPPYTNQQKYICRPDLSEKPRHCLLSKSIRHKRNIFLTVLISWETVVPIAGFSTSWYN